MTRNGRAAPGLALALATLTVLVAPALAHATPPLPGATVLAGHDWRITPTFTCTGPRQGKVVFNLELREDPRFVGGLTIDGRDAGRVDLTVDVGHANPEITFTLPDDAQHAFYAKGELWDIDRPTKGLDTGSATSTFACPGPPPPPTVIKQVVEREKVVYKHKRARCHCKPKHGKPGHHHTRKCRPKASKPRKPKCGASNCRTSTNRVPRTAG